MRLALAAGKSTEAATEQAGQVVEGVGAARVISEQVQKLGISMATIEQFYRIVVSPG